MRRAAAALAQRPPSQRRGDSFPPEVRILPVDSVTASRPSTSAPPSPGPPVKPARVHFAIWQVQVLRSGEQAKRSGPGVSQLTFSAKSVAAVRLRTETGG